MAFVSGADIPKGYCALSYSWNQSEDTEYDPTTNKCTHVDNGEHRIVSVRPNDDFALLETSYQCDDSVVRSKESYVYFEGIIEKICRDFYVRYIWCDQMCIDQEDNEKKLREIRKMHLIYRNAYCTIALVPELTLHELRTNIHYGTRWFKRLWTFEEAILSKQMLFVDKKYHTWTKDMLSKSGGLCLFEEPPENFR